MFQRVLLVFGGFGLGVLATYVLVSGGGERTVDLDELPTPYYSVLWENDDIRLVEHRLNVGEREPMHSHPKMVGYFLETASIRITEADGTVSEPRIIKGEIGVVGPWTHEIENIGDTPFHSLIGERKAAPVPSGEAGD